MPCPLPRRIEQVHASITSPLTRPSPNGRRVGIRIVTFEACSGFTRVTARRIAQPPKATFVTRLQPARLPARAARQLPDQSTTLRVESSSTSDARLRGALPKADVRLFCVRNLPNSREVQQRPKGRSSCMPLLDRSTGTAPNHRIFDKDSMRIMQSIETIAKNGSETLLTDDRP